MLFYISPADARRLARPGKIPMNNATLRDHLLGLFARNEVTLEVDEDDWLVTDDDFPAIRATWHNPDGDVPGHLDVDIVLDEERRIEQSFVGSGAGDEACRDALQRFTDHALYPLLAACWYVTDDRKMRIEAWDIGLRTWDAFIGPPSVRSETPLDVPASVLAAVDETIKKEMLTPALHWVTVFHALDSDGNRRAEASLDNEPWAAGSAALLATTWPANTSAHTVSWLTLLDVRDY
jgi:hypothetical protein